MTPEPILEAIVKHDWDATERARGAQISIVPSVAAALPRLDEESREIAVACIVEEDAPGAGGLLLEMTADDCLQVAAAAANGVERVTAPPAAAAILAVIPHRKEAFVRGVLYRAATRGGDATHRDTLRALADAEADAEALREATAALVKLGDPEARRRLLALTQTATSAGALRIQGQLLFIGDRTLAKGTLPWLENTTGVLQLGCDLDPWMARMCDVAVWTAHLLGVDLPIKPEHLAIFDEAVIAGARDALQRLPDGAP
jgi:hypothetical protein